MWTAKFKIRHDDCWLVPKTSKFNISAIGIPLNSYEKKGIKYHNGMCFLKGKKEDKLKFLASLKKDKTIKKFTIKGDQVFVLIEGDDNIANVFDASLFFIKPVVANKGYEYWELGSWERKSLTEFYDRVKNVAKIEILQLKKQTPAVFVQQAIPKLTEKQRKAIELAHEFGYYSYPRKISVEELAKKAKTPRTTFQEHLRKAEAKMMNLLIEPMAGI
jgi:predicted DNA binding protein